LGFKAPQKLNERLNLMKKQSMLLSLLFSTICSVALMTCVVGAQTTYDAAIDFGSSNPSGPWSYWYASSTNLTSNFTKLNSQGVTSDYITWTNSESSVVYPAVWKNIGANTIFGVPANSIALHPGLGTTDELYTVLRFIAPSSGTYDTSIQFFQGDLGETTALILYNNDLRNPLFSSPTTLSDPIYSNALSLQTGDIIDIMVGPLGFDWSDNTPVNAVLVVPEPPTYALLGIGAMGLLLVLRKKKTA
jgi:PEP-CTERM motif